MRGKALYFRWNKGFLEAETAADWGHSGRLMTGKRLS